MLPYPGFGCWMGVKFIPPLLQGGLDLQQGLQHLSVAALMPMVPCENPAELKAVFLNVC